MEQNFELKVDINGINIWFFVNLGNEYYKPSKKVVIWFLSHLIFLNKQKMKMQYKNF
jgi:hypothetical protein